MRGDVRREAPEVLLCLLPTSSYLCPPPRGGPVANTRLLCPAPGGLLPTPGCCCVRFPGGCCQHPAVVVSGSGAFHSFFIRSSVVLISCKLWIVIDNRFFFYVLYLQRIRVLAFSHSGSSRVKERYPAHSCEPSFVKEYRTTISGCFA